MAVIDDLHPDAVWCGSQRQETMKSTGLKVEVEARTCGMSKPWCWALKSSPLIMELEAWNVVKEQRTSPGAHHWHVELRQPRSCPSQS